MAVSEERNLLIDQLPEAIEINGNSYPIATDFRTGIEYELMLEDVRFSDEQKLIYAIALYYGEDIPIKEDDLEAAVEGIMWFHRCGEPEPKKPRKKEQDDSAQKPLLNDSSKRVFSYRCDAPYVYAAFLSQYGIDLVDTEYLHWWKYSALLKSIKDEELICKIMNYRGVELSSIKDKAERRRISKLKALYAIPNDIKITEQKQLDEIAFGSAREASKVERTQ